MKTRLFRRILVLFTAFVFASATAFCAGAAAGSTTATPASGPLGFSFTSLNTAVFDLTGSYQFQHEVMLRGGTSLSLLLGCRMEQEATGRLSGSGTTNIQVGGEVFSAQYSVKGKIAGGGGKPTRAVVNIRWTAQATVDGVSDALTISVRYNLDVTPAVLSGLARGKVKFGHSGSASIKSPVSDVSLPAGADGSWAVQMDLQPPGGSGAILLSSGRTLQARPAVKFSGRTGRQRIKLAGSGADRGTSLSLSFVPATGTLESVTGKLLGQKVMVKGAQVQAVAQIDPSLAASSGVAGYQACLECHTPIQQTLSFTRHARVGVECESCHGPAAAHAANDYDPLTRPLVPYAGTTCGTCHSGPRHPVYEEWQASAHSQVAVDMNSPGRLSSCGRCHSGSVRVNLVDGTPLPTGDLNVPLGCPTCHQPHQLTGQPDQLRNPLFSTDDYSLATSAVFTNAYNPNINLCAQCHNRRGAEWTDTGRAPHHSPQYNILLGTVGELASGLPPYDPAAHALLITNQCVGCHMQRSAYQSPTQPAVTGHQFEVNSYAFCAGCHGSAANASNLVVFASTVVSSQIQTLKASLDYWATNRAPASLSAKYGTRAWEYTVPGELSPGGPGPDASEQALIPDDIKKARFNLYVVLYDGSFGTHNGPYAIMLLDTAQNWVDQLLTP